MNLRGYFSRSLAALLIAAPALLGPLAGWRCADGRPCPFGFPILQPMHAEAEAPAAQSGACAACPSKKHGSSGAREENAPSEQICILDAGKWSATQPHAERAPEPPPAAIVPVSAELELQPLNPVIEIAGQLGPREARSGPYRGRAPPLA